jgi:molecular chaperone GrpE
MAFEDYFDDFFGNRRFLEKPRENNKITLEKYKQLLEKAEKYDAIEAKYEEIKSKNETLTKDIEQLKEEATKIKLTLEEKEAYIKKLVRAQADFENYKKMTERETQKYKSFALEQIIKKLISHYDDLIRASHVLELIENGDGIRKGFDMLVKNFEKILEDEGIKPMNSEKQIFDPYKHEAVLVEEREDDLPENTIVEEIEKGYYYKDIVLRPAKVKISKKKSILKIDNENKNNENKNIKGSE